MPQGACRVTGDHKPNKAGWRSDWIFKTSLETQGLEGKESLGINGKGTASSCGISLFQKCMTIDACGSALPWTLHIAGA